MIHECIVEDEQLSIQRFSQRTSDKTKWDVIDHYVYFVKFIYDENINNTDSIFYERGLSKINCYNWVWWLLKCCTIDTVLSCQKNFKAYNLLLKNQSHKLLRSTSDLNVTLYTHADDSIHSTPDLKRNQRQHDSWSD